MSSPRINILVMEPSEIVYEGLSHLLLKSDSHFHVYRTTDMNELKMTLANNNIHAILSNPSLILNRVKEARRIRHDYPNIKWVGLLYQLYPQDVLDFFDETYSITDSAENLIHQIKQHRISSTQESTVQEPLSEREKEVLINMAQGLSNKEIAEKLFISIHTVMSHRKNIMQKTGIRSQSGLTIFAITQGLIAV